MHMPALVSPPLPELPPPELPAELPPEPAPEPPPAVAPPAAPEPAPDEPAPGFESELEPQPALAGIAARIATAAQCLLITPAAYARNA
jgi:hypothetical protein